MDIRCGRAAAEVQEMRAVNSRSCRSELQLIAACPKGPVSKAPFPLMLKWHVWREKLLRE